MHAPKRTPEGRAERLDALRPALPDAAPFFRRMLARFPRRDVGADDILDALALAVAALRMEHGRARRVPESPPRDARGLRMEIWA